MGVQKVSPKLKWGYAFGGIGKDMCYALVSNYLMYYCTENLGISALFMGVLFFFARLWDAINDPIMGTFVDNTRIKFGKYRFWMLVGTLANVVAVIFLFNPYLASHAPRIYIAVFYVIWGMTYTMVDVPYWAFNSNVSDDRKERESVS
ncbi:MAG: MFS transporter, partial [Clostridia bacterium]|nr:MFS transporter [Clostridia bacterium]